ncbi:MAG TPA: hypothetical protein VKV96_07065, partial [Roseiarcus sp.]|nr:hypothetical protein [Roseiarcus sp.]
RDALPTELTAPARGLYSYQNSLQKASSVESLTREGVNLHTIASGRDEKRAASPPRRPPIKIFLIAWNKAADPERSAAISRRNI